MGSDRTAGLIDASLRSFASSLRDQAGAEHVFLFGSRARGDARPDSDYDLIVISPRFEGLEPRARARGLRRMWYQAGGVGPMDLFCLTPAEFAESRMRATLIAAALPEAIDLLAA